MLASVVLLASSLTGCINFDGWKTVHGSGNVITETRDVSGFDHVSVSGAGNLALVQGAEESLTIQADDNLLPLIRSSVSNGHLSIGPDNVNLHPTQTIRYRLQLKNLGGLQLSGSVHAEGETIKADHLALGISGSGNVSIAQLESRTLSANISGSGNISAAGVVEAQKIHISGSGNHRAADLKCEQADAHISGSGHASLWVNNSLSAHISGSGRIEYRGNPRVDSHISGSGQVHQRDGM